MSATRRLLVVSLCLFFVTAFLAATPAFAAKLKIVPADKPHVIDLLEPLGF